MIQNAKASDRVSRNTAQQINDWIATQIEQSVTFYAEHTDRIDDRLRELDEEWDVERVLQRNASVLMVLGLVFGALFGARWRVLSLLVGGFLFQHAVQGWCPPLPIIRRMGVRTRDEIARERYALKLLRGDFDQAGDMRNQPGKARAVLDAITR